MSVEALVEAIESAATAEAARLLADADAAVTARIAEAEATSRSRVAAALAAAEPAILGAEARTVNEARLRLVALRTAWLAARTEAAFRLAEDRLDAIVGGEDRDRWERALRTLATESAALVGSGELRVRPADLPPVSAAIGNPSSANLSVVADPDTPAGVRGRSEDGRVTVDATIAERLRRARATLVPAVAARLREGDPAPRELVTTGS